MREPKFCVTTLPPDDKAVRASTGSHKITRDFSDIFFIVLWDCERALRYKYFNIECTLGRSQKQQSSSIRSRQAVASTTENTHSHSRTFVALEKSFAVALHSFIFHNSHVLCMLCICTRACCAATPTTSFATHSLSTIDLRDTVIVHIFL